MNEVRLQRPLSGFGLLDMKDLTDWCLTETA